jgi:hypothetical protein
MHSQGEHSSATPKSYKQSPLSEPDRIRIDTSTIQVVDYLVVGVVHIPRSWSKEVHKMNISCVHSDIPKDLTLAAEESSHPPLPHLVVLAIEVWRT